MIAHDVRSFHPWQVRAGGELGLLKFCGTTANL